MTGGRVVVMGGRVVCPHTRVDEVLDIVIDEGRVAALVPSGSTVPAGARTVDAGGAWVLPGGVDLCCYAREPGREEDEPLETTFASAVRGGFTTLLLMPNTTPATDGADDVEHRLARAASITSASTSAGTTGGPRVVVAGALSRRREGKELAEIGEMTRAGARAFTDAPDPIVDVELLRRAMEYTAGFGGLVVQRGLDPRLAPRDGAVMLEGRLATRLGLPAAPVAAETLVVLTALELARTSGARLHLGPLATARGLALVEAARADGVQVTAEVHPFHLVLDEQAHMARPYDTALRLDPPLPTVDDRRVLLEGVRRGALVVASGHRPVSRTHKDLEMALAEPGAPSLTCTLPVLAGGEMLDAPALARATSEGPARILGLTDAGQIAVGARADLVVLDPAVSAIVRDPLSPFDGKHMRARVRATLVAGRVVYDGATA